VARYSDADKTKALTIAQELGAAEASRATGIPAGTIRSWLHRTQRRNGQKRCNGRPATQRRTPKLKAVQEDVLEKARQEAAEYTAERLKELTDRLYSVTDRAVARVLEMIDEIEPRQGDRDTAAWLRALVGAMHYGLQDGQLLAGQPTGRTETLTGKEARERLTGKIDELAQRRV